MFKWCVKSLIDEKKRNNGMQKYSKAETETNNKHALSALFQSM